MRNKVRWPKNDHRPRIAVRGNANLSQHNPELNDLLYQPQTAPSVSDSQSIGSSERRHSPSLGSASTSMTGASNFMLGLGPSSLRDPGAYLEATMATKHTPEICAKLWEVYANRVDPIVRVFHQPTLHEFVVMGKTYLKYQDGDPTLNLIRSSVFFVAIATLQDSQCRALFGLDKQALMDNYRNACELFLQQVDLIVTEDIAVLQSFMLYLVIELTFISFFANCNSWQYVRTIEVVKHGLCLQWQSGLRPR